ncbi:MAG: hypothetical protein ACLUNX_09485 [Angelakisella sp.]
MVEYSKLQNGSDIRGVALPLVAAEPVNLTEEAAGQIGRAFATWLVERCGKPAEELRIGGDEIAVFRAQPAAGRTDRTGGHGGRGGRLRHGQHPGYVYGDGAAGLRF